MISYNEYAVLLATYNGAHFLNEQIDSIMSDLPFGTVYINDDFSVDGTMEVIISAHKKYNDRIKLMSSGIHHGSACKNFNYLLNNILSDYYFLSDQDDVWLKGRSKVLIDKMKEAEGIAGKDCPILICSDMKVVDVRLNVISNSFWKYAGTNPRKKISINKCLVENLFPGCGMLANKALIDLATPIPEEAIMHDWWLVLVSLFFGRLEYVSEPTLLYRQHDNNDTGAKKYSIYHALSLCSCGNIRASLFKYLRQAIAFEKKYGFMIDGDKKIVDNFIQMFSCDPFTKRYIMLKNKYFKSSFLKNMGMFLFL